MERKEIFSIVAACCAVCMLIFVFGTIKGTNEPNGEASSSADPAPAVTAATSTNYWDQFHQQQSVTSETTTAPAESGDPSESEESNSEGTSLSSSSVSSTVSTSTKASTSSFSPSYSISYSGT